MKDLIQRDGERLYTTSLSIANLLGMSHPVIFRNIKKYLHEIEEFGKVGFENRPSDNGQKISYAVLTDDQAYVRNPQ